MAIAIYARISDDRQDGAGVERQLADCLRKVEGQDVVKYVDNDLSAFAGKRRPRYQAMLDAIRAGQVDRIVVYHIDRLYRQTRELLDLIDLADAGKVTIDSVYSGPIDLSTSDGRFVAKILVNVAEKESEDKSRRIRRQKQQAKEQGKVLGGPRAFGWRTGETKGTLVQDPTEIALLKEAVDQLLAGASLNDVARRWNAQEVPTPQGRRDHKKNPVDPPDWKGRWTPTTVKNVVSNRRHVGAVIESTRWQQLQALLQRRSTFARVPRRRSLLTGVVVCSLCGHRMVRTGAGEGRHAFRCPNGTGCGKVSIDATGLENLLVEATLLHADRGDLARIVKKMGKGGEQDRVMAQLDSLNLREDEMSESFAVGKLPLSAFEKATAALAAERRAMTSSLSRMTSASVISPYVGKPGALRAAWDTMTTDQRREVIKLVLGKIEVTPALKRGMPGFDKRRVTIA
jgi:site-specific DNA recombinase